MDDQQQHSNFSASRRVQVGQVLGGSFKLIEKIGAGSFGAVYKTQNLKNGEIVATKFERREDKNSSNNFTSLLVREIKVLTQMKGTEGFPQILFYGREEFYNFFMETYLGNNLEELLVKCGNKLSLPSTLKIGIQMLTRIQSLHSKNFIHRDIKPENFVIGKQNIGLVYIIDFGLSKYYRDTNGSHIPVISNKGLIGTARYASVNALKGNEQSRRDDIEAIGYVLLYLYLGKLPWMNLQISKKEEKYLKILEIKQDITIEKLCENCPKCFEEYFRYTMKLTFEEEPDYKFLNSLLSDELKKIDTDDYLDWQKLEEFKRFNDISIEEGLQEIEVPSMLDEGNINQTISKIHSQDPKFLSNKKISTSLTNIVSNMNKLYLKVPMALANESNVNYFCFFNFEQISPLNASFDSSKFSKLNHYQHSCQKMSSSNGLFMFPSSKQFDDIKLQSKWEICSPTKKIEELLKQKDELVGDGFEDFEVSQDDQANIEKKKPRTFSFQKEKSVKQ